MMKTLKVAVFAGGGVIRHVICAALLLGFASSTVAGNVTLTWDASATPATLGDAETGLLEFTYTADNIVSNITAKPVDGGVIVLTGDTVSLCSTPHVIMAAGGELVFSNTVSSAWNLEVESTADSSERSISYSGAAIGTEYVTLFPDRNLDDWTPYTTGGAGWWSTDGVLTYNIRREADGSVTAQRQALSGNLVLAVKFQLKQVGADIAGRCVYSGYWNRTLGKGVLGDDADAVIANPLAYGHFQNQGVTLASNPNSGYGIKKMTLIRVGGLPTVRFAGGLSCYRLYVRGYTHLIFERAKTGDVYGGYDVSACGMLTFRDPQYGFNLNKKSDGSNAPGFWGPGTIVLEATDMLYGDETTETTTVSYTPWLTTDWVTVAEGQDLGKLTSVTARWGGAAAHSSTRTTVPIQLLTALDGEGHRYGEFQQKTGWTATPNLVGCVKVEFRQNGPDVQMRALYATYGNLAEYGGVLTEHEHFAVADSDSVQQYGVSQLSLGFATPVKYATISGYPGMLNMVGAATQPGGKTVLAVKGTSNTKMRYATNYPYAVPGTDGLFLVQNGGEFVTQIDGASYTERYTFDRSVIRIEEGGVIRQQNKWGLGWTQRVDIVCGDFKAYDHSGIAMGQSILNFVTFSGNTHLYSARGGASDHVQAGYNMDSVWTVRGTSASTCDISLKLWGAAEAAAGGNTMTFAVNDVTGDSASDFIMNGSVSLIAAEPDILGVYKTGPGTMQLNKSYNLSGKPTHLKDGTWLLNGSSLTSAADPYTIDGCTLAVADGTSNSMGVLTVGENGGGITLGAGATLAFADSSAAEWTAGGNVVVTGFAEKSVRFGTSRAGLTDAQRRRFRTGEGRRLHIDGDGWLTGNIGMLIFVK